MKIRLRTKILALTIGLITLLGATVAVLVKTTLTDALLSEFRENSIFQSRQLAEIVVPDLLTENMVRLNLLLNEHKKNDRHIQYIFIKNAEGKVTAHTFGEEGFPAALLEVSKAGTVNEYSVAHFTTETDDIIDVAVPILKGQAGVLRAGFTENPLLEKVKGIITLILVIIIIVLVIGAAAAVVLASVITRPVHRLSEAAREIGNGNLNCRAQVRSRDEIGQLGMTFNRMVEDLKETTVSRDYLDMMINSMPDIVLIVDRDLKIRMANRSVERLLGHGAASLTGRPFTVICGDDKACFNNVQMLFKEGRFPGTATYYRRKDGTTVPVIISASTIRSGSGSADEIVIIAKDNTEYVKTQERLVDERDRAQNYLDVAGVMLLALNTKGNVTLINRKGCEILGYGEHEIIGMSWFDNFLPESARAEVKDVFNRVAAGTLENCEQYENPVLTKSGEEKIIAWRNTMLKDKNGRITGALSSGEDITGRREAEEALCQSRQMLVKEHEKLTLLFGKVELAKKEWEKTMDCVGEMILLTKEDGTIQRINRRVAEVINMPYQEILGRAWEELLNEQGMESRTFYAGGVELFQKTTGKWYVLNSYPFTSGDIGYSGAVITLHDTTELKLVTEKLEETTRKIDSDKEKLQKALDQICVLIQNVTHQKNFEIGLSNPHLKKCYEVKNCSKTACPCYGKEAVRCWQIAGTFCGGEIQGAFAQKYGNCKKCNVFRDAMSDPVSQISEQFNNMMHVLEMKNKELAKAYAELKATQAQILQREKMASIGQLAAGVAHEINNPMGFISSNLGTLGKYVNKLTEFIEAQSAIVESLQSAEAPEKLNELRKKLKLDYILTDLTQLIRESLDGADRVKKIVQNLKSFSRVDEAEYKYADINECIESTLNIVWNELKYKATLTKEYGALPQTKCYPQQLNQVFMNLLVNAAQALEKQGEIKIKTWNGDGSINITISDTGSGIPRDKVSRIFEPFYTTKPVGQGTGLGLSITYDIVKKHNGDIKVDSEVGKGTVFTVKIPVVEEK
ncbi:MAG: PAS domain S-box protein [Nitrospiraceae bacterium]|nr:MAG: PAS domain S-box protein [Nitrospiraceae bacterium]